MAEYIDRGALCKQLSLMAERYNALGQVKIAQEYNWAVTLLDGVPTEDVAPVRYGRWERRFCHPMRNGEWQYICSVCKDDDYWNKNVCTHKHSYCPNCGARMDGDSE